MFISKLYVYLYSITLNNIIMNKYVFKTVDFNQESIINGILDLIDAYSNDINLTDFTVKTGFINDDVVKGKITIKISYNE